MYNKELMVLSTFEDIIFSIELILKRFKTIKSGNDFLEDDGLENLDSKSSVWLQLERDLKILINLPIKHYYPNIQASIGKAYNG